MKTMMAFVQFVYVSQCPWQDQLQSRYIMMALVSIITMYQTVHISIIILLTKGWLYIRSVLTKEDLNSLSMIMGLVYMSYSVFFVTANIPKLQWITNSWMNILYSIIFLYVMK